MLRLAWIMEQRDDLYDELIIDRVIGLASYWAEGAQGFFLFLFLAPLKESHYSALCGRQRANSRSNIHHGEHTHNYPRLNGANFTKSLCSELKLTIGGHLGRVGQHYC